MSAPDWIAVDWGTSQLRVWLMSDAGAVLASHTSPKGMGKLTPSEYEPTLLDLVGAALPEDRATPVVICGMAGARQGWQEAPYAKRPASRPRRSLPPRSRPKTRGFRCISFPAYPKTNPQT